MADEGAWAFVRHGGGWCAQERLPGARDVREGRRNADRARGAALQSRMTTRKWSACLIPVTMAAAGWTSWTGERMQGRL